MDLRGQQPGAGLVGLIAGDGFLRFSFQQLKFTRCSLLHALLGELTLLLRDGLL